MGFLRPVLSLDHLSDEEDDGRRNEQSKYCKGKNSENCCHLCLLLLSDPALSLCFQP